MSSLFEKNQLFPNKQTFPTSALPEISFHLNNLAGGGAEKVLLTLASYFSKLKSVDLVVSRGVGQRKKQIPDRVNFFDLKAPTSVRGVWKLKTYLESRHPQILLSTTRQANLNNIWATQLSKTDTKSILRISGSPSRIHKNPSQRVDKFLPRLIRQFYPRADQIVIPAQNLKDDLSNFAKTEFENITHIPNPINITSILKKADQKTHHPWLVEKDIPVIVTAGRLTEAKNHAMLLKAFKLVLDKIPAKLIILGSGRLEKILKKTAQTLNIEQDVDFAGFKNNPYPYYKQADLFALSSIWEGFPNVLLEVLALGRTIVSTDCLSGPSEILGNGKYGHLVEPNNTEQFAQKIIDVLSEKSLIPPDKLKRRAEKYNLNSIGEQYSELFNLSLKE